MRYLSLVLYALLLIPFFLLWYAQSRVRRVFREADAVPNARQVTGLETARSLLNQAGLYDVSIEVADDLAGDHYNPATRVLHLSPRTARAESTLSVGIAAHEVGHAIQDAEGYSLMRAHTVLARWLMVLGTIIPLAFIGGFLLGSLPLMLIAVGILALQVVFAFITLPLERNATKRALQLLQERGLILPSEESRIQRVLRAAAFTYLASVGIRVASFLFWFIILATLTGLGV